MSSHMVVVGIDGSPQSMAAADWAALEARRTGRPLRLVHAWHPLATDADYPLHAESRHRWVENRLSAVHQTLAERLPGLRIEVERVAEAPVKVLLAEEAELLVLGSRGLSGMSGHLLGSVSLSVIARTARPVVLVRADFDGRAEDSGTVVLGLDLRHYGNAPIDFAFRAAAARGTSLLVVHAWNPQLVYGYASAPLDEELTAELQEREERSLTGILGPWRAKYPEVAVTGRVAAGSAGRVLIEAAGGAGLLVTGHQLDHPGHSSRIGHVTHGVLHHAACPVAVVPHDGEPDGDRDGGPAA
ncbi:universal stress protein [Streptomyces sp. WAC 00631]|uniref:universal stress protein n=1 Tax=Streptomyces sp. WAC 00631 TaxID=2203201 RepID=UPI001E3E1977|nr:universal stress protein [Streptomyces sp. WAC 00631]MCC5033862.1 universal stress protein [Streptomyces sp. WAC 00631]